ncbi:MAG: PEP-CTERM sorting domain-containing protein [Janthinobacterium lividum]
MFPKLCRLAGPLALAGAFGILFSAGAARAQFQVVVAPTTTFNGSLYHYSYSVTNFTPDDLYVINLNGLPLVPGALTDFSAPDGYEITNPYDSGVGIESFLADNTFASGSVVSGFSFDSLYAPAPIMFDTVSSGTASYTGMTIGPAGAPVPEASTLISLGTGLLVLTFAVVRRRRMAVATHS